MSQADCVTNITSHRVLSQAPYRVIGRWLLPGLAIAILLVVTLLDYVLFFEAYPGPIVPHRAVALVAFAVLGLFLFVPKRPAGFAIYSLGLLWLLALPHVRWPTGGKAFFVDAHGVEEGMSMEEVRERMGAYPEVGRTYLPGPEEWYLSAELPLMVDQEGNGTALFIRDGGRWVDSLEVHFTKGEADRITIVKD